MKTPKVLRIIGEESKGNGTNTLTSRQLDQVIKAYRAEKRKPRAHEDTESPPRPSSDREAKSKAQSPKAHLA